MSTISHRLRRTIGLTAAAALVCVAPSVASAHGTAPSGRAPAQVRPAANDEPSIEDEILVLINASRAAAGLAPLQRNPVLDAAADEWTAHLIAGECPNNALLCHRSRTSLAALAKAATAPGGYKWWAENVQVTVGRAQTSHDRLMNSAGHRANLMRPETNLIGIGAAIAPNGYMYVTQEFTQSKPIPPPPPPRHACGRITQTLASGSRGSQVRVLQCALAMLGLFPGTQDGRFGKTTKAAVIEFQRLRGITMSGKVSLSTRQALGVTT